MADVAAVLPLHTGHARERWPKDGKAGGESQRAGPRLAFAWLLVAVALAPAQVATRPAQPDLGPLLSQIATLDARAADPSLDPSERTEAADEAIESRVQLLDAGKHDDWSAVWAADLAAALLDRLTREAIDSDVLLALAAPDHRASARSTAETARSLLERAGERAATVLARLDAQTDLTPEQSDLLSRLTGVEPAVRRPYLRARADLLLGSVLQVEGDATRAHRLAADAADAWRRIALDAGPAEAGRLVNLAIACLQLAQTDRAAEALAAFDQLHRDGVAIGQATMQESALAHTWVAVLRDPTEQRARAAWAQAPSRVGAGMADIRFRSRVAAAAARSLALIADRERNVALLAAACRIVSDCADEAAVADEPSPRRWDVRSWEAASLRALVERPCMTWAPPEALPALARLAFALLIRHDDPERAITLVDDAIRASENERFRADAMRLLAEMFAERTDTESRLRAADVWMELEAMGARRQSPLNPLDLALRLLRDLHQSHPSDPAVRSRYLAALQRQNTFGPTGGDQVFWRLEHARVVARMSDPAAADILAALTSLEGIAGGDGMAESAATYYVLLARAALEARTSRIVSARREGDEATISALALESVAIAERAAAWAAPRIDRSLWFFQTEAAVARVESGSAEGLGTLESKQRAMEQGLATDLDPVRVALYLGRARLLANQTEGAFATLRSLAASLDAPAADPAAPPRREEFWHAWALMLEVLQTQNADGSRSAAVRAHSTRLRAIDPQLGGTPWRERIERAAARVR